MQALPQRRLAAHFSVELLVWLLPPLLFLFDYVLTWHRPLAGALAHLRLALLLISAVLLLRTVLLRRGRSRWHLAAGALLSGTLLFTLVAYYALVITVLGIWGRVVTVEVISIYGAAAPQLSATVGIAFPLALVLLATAFAGGCALFYVLLRRLPWLPPVARPRALVDALLVSLSLLVVYRVADALTVPTRVGEPFALTLWTGKPGHAARNYTQGLTVPAAYSARERAAEAAYVPAPSPPRTSLVLIVVDGLRYDHLGVDGYGRATTPYLSALAGAGILGVSPQIHSSCAETTCGLSSLASSRYSFDMPTRPFTLAKVVKRHGYRVRMILGDVHNEPELLYGKVDDFYDGTRLKEGHVDDDTHLMAVTDRLPAWDGQPLMLQYHLMAAHTLGIKQARYQVFGPVKEYAGRLHGPQDPGFTNLYDGGVLQMDTEVHHVLDQLAAKGYLHDTLVVLTADHGEGLGEHGLLSHTNSVYEELLHIPLLTLRYRDGHALPLRGFAQFGSQIDIAPTILHELGMPIPATWSGVPLQLGRVPAFTFYQMVPYLGLFDHRDPRHLWKYFTDRYERREYAFDLSTDPGERINRVAQVAPATLALWRAQLDSHDRGIAASQVGRQD